MGACSSNPHKPKRTGNKKRLLSSKKSLLGVMDLDDVAEIAALKAIENRMQGSDSASTTAATVSEPPSRGNSERFAEFGSDDLPHLCGAPEADARTLLCSIYAGQAYASAFLEDEAVCMGAMQLRSRLLELAPPQRRPALRYAFVAAPELRAWYLDDNRLAERGLDVVFEAMAAGRSPELLSLAGNDINDLSMQRLSKALSAQCQNKNVGTELRVLCLSSNLVGDDGIASIADALTRCSSLELLDLRNNRIGPDGARSFAFSLVADACGIRRLRLGGNSIDDEGAKCLAEALKRCPRLEELGLERNNISDAGAKHLADALRGDVTLLLAGNSLTQAGKAMMREAKSKISAQGAFCTVTV